MTPRTIACQASLSMEFSRKGYWSGLPFPSPEDLTKPGIKPESPALQADSLLSGPPGSKKSEAHFLIKFVLSDHIPWNTRHIQLSNPYDVFQNLKKFILYWHRAVLKCLVSGVQQSDSVL